MPGKGLLTLGAFIIIVAITLILFSYAYIVLKEVLPLIIALFGAWLIVLAGIRAANPSKYERSPFSTFAWGILILIVGTSWILSIRQVLTPIVAFASVLIVIGVIAVVAALKKRG